MHTIITSRYDVVVVGSAGSRRRDGISAASEPAPSLARSGARQSRRARVATRWARSTRRIRRRPTTTPPSESRALSPRTTSMPDDKPTDDVQAAFSAALQKFMGRRSRKVPKADSAAGQKALEKCLCALVDYEGEIKDQLREMGGSDWDHHRVCDALRKLLGE